MDRQIVILVRDEASANEVVRALKGLDDEGAIELHSSTVVMKTATGSLTIESTYDHRGPWAAALGVSTGALIGLLAGPVGAAVGAAIGGAAALGRELAYTGFAGDFVHAVTGSLEAGSYAVCASVFEDWTAPVDVATAPLGVVVFRQATDDIVMAQIRGEWRELGEEADQLEAEIARATGDAKAKLETKRNEVRAKQAAQRERLRTRASKLQEGWQAEIASIKAKADGAKADAKARHEQHAEKLSRFASAQKASFHDLFA